MGNNALNTNPPMADIHLSTKGSDWLWAVFALSALSLLIATLFSFMRPRGSRLFHQIAIAILVTMSISYFSMASDLGAAPVPVEFRGHGGDPTRQVFYVRYIQWFISLPLILLELLLVTGLSLSDVLSTLFFGVLLVINGLIGALVPSRYKWGYFVFGLFGLCLIWHSLILNAPRAAFAEGGISKGSYMLCAFWLSFILALYPICWGLSEGGNVISVTGEMIFYGILDLLAGPLFLAVFLSRVGSVDHSVFKFSSGKFSDTTVVKG